ncbi:MAG: M48 family metalloprotease [Myxococcota bacterium]
MNSSLVRHHKAQDQLKTIGLVALLTLTVGWVGYTVFGPFGLFIAATLLALGAGGANISPEWPIRLQGGRRLSFYAAPELHELVTQLSRRAHVRVPTVMLIPSDVPNAMATGSAEGPSAIGITRGALRMLTQRELTGVLAHEIAHLVNGDTRLLRWTGTATQSLVLGLRFTLWASVLVALFSGNGLALAFQLMVLALVVPAALTLMTAALSRTREFAADRTAAEITADPQGLASALHRLQQFERGWLRSALPQLPGALRSHPPTEERVARLLAMTDPNRVRHSRHSVQSVSPRPANRRLVRVALF